MYGVQYVLPFPLSGKWVATLYVVVWVVVVCLTGWRVLYLCSDWVLS